MESFRVLLLGAAWGMGAYASDVACCVALVVAGVALSRLVVLPLLGTAWVMAAYVTGGHNVACSVGACCMRCCLGW